MICARGVARTNSTVKCNCHEVPLGDSPYNGLKLDVNRRFSNGLSLNGVYTWSKALRGVDNTSAIPMSRTCSRKSWP